MGGRSCIASGDWFQLPPVKNDYIFKNNRQDGRPACAPSHWNENYRIYFLTEKVRSQSDPKFGEVCDRIGRDEITQEDELYLNNLVRVCPHDDDNDLFKTGKHAIIVTTNDQRQQINDEKITKLLQNEPHIICICEDVCTNLPSAPPPPEKLPYTKTKNLPHTITLKVGMPIVITVNDRKYKEDGVSNGAKGYVDSFQFNQ